LPGFSLFVALSSRSAACSVLATSEFRTASPSQFISKPVSSRWTSAAAVGVKKCREYCCITSAVVVLGSR